MENFNQIILKVEKFSLKENPMKKNLMSFTIFHFVKIITSFT